MSQASVPRSSWQAFWRSPAALYGGFLLAVWFRFHNLQALPIYWDEAYHIYYARAPLLANQYFSVFPSARWLNVMLIALLQPMGLESLWVARSVSVLLSLISAACGYWLGAWLGNRQTGRWAMALYLVMPFAFFYDRQALADPVMAAFGALGVIFSVRTLQSLRLRDAVVSGLCLAMAALTKFAGLLYLPLIFAGIWLLPIPRRRRATGLAALQTTICVGLFAVVFILAQKENGPSNTLAGANNWCHSPLCSGHLEIGQALMLAATNLRLYADMIPSFYTPTIWLLAAGALFTAKGVVRRRALFLSVLAFALALPYIVIADLFPPRYLTFTLAAVAALAACSFGAILNWSARIAATTNRQTIYRTGLATVLLAPALGLELWQMVLPMTAPIPIWEWTFYSAGWPNSLTAKWIADDLYLAEKQSGERINVVAGAFYLELNAYWGQRLGQVQTTRDITEQTIIPWLASNAPVCLVEVTPKFALGDHPFGFVLKQISVYNVPGSEAHPDQFGGPSKATLWCVTGTTASLSRKIADYIFGDPANANDYYRPIGDMLRGFSGPIVLYPPNQLEMIQSLPGLSHANLRPLGNSWPVSQEQIGAELSRIVASSDEIRVVLALEDRGDPNHRVEGLLNSEYFPVDVQFSGPVRVLRFLTAHSIKAAEVETGKGQLSGLGRLTRAVILDPNVPANRLVRILLTWEPDQMPLVSYKSFTHVSDAQGQLVAQHDGIPQAGFDPTSAWKPTQPVTDRFTIYFPPEIQAGSYTVATGMYDPDTGQRLATSDGRDSLVIGQVTVP